MIPFLKAPVFSPKGLMVRALWIVVAFGVFTVLGVQEYTCVICGTSPSGNPADTAAILLGMGYCLLFFAFTMLAPSLFLGGIFMAILIAVSEKPPAQE
jgi:hypothetical protein